MKKKWFTERGDKHLFIKWLRIMKLTTFMLLVTCMHLSASVYSQQTKLDISLENTSVREMLKLIEDQSNYFFLYTNEDIDVERKVSVHVKGKKVEDILDRIFEKTDVTYQISDRQIVLTKENGNEFFGTQQARTITGKVTDSSGQALPGVTVVLKGTTQGTVTDFDGNYSISDVPAGSTLVFSFVGMRSQEIVVGNQSTINVVMEEDAIGIEEVVAIGYGTMRKIDLTGAVTKVNIAEMNELPNLSVMQSLQGAVAGLNIGAVDQAGENPSISIRGQNTLSESSDANQPLIVVDGTIYRGSLVDLNPADIESVDILKDASSAAIYGSQASNGVMLITTKKGTVNSKPIISYNANYSVDVASNKIEPMQRQEYLEFFPDVFWANGARLGPDYVQPNPDFTVESFLKTNWLSKGFADGTNTDWYGAFTGNGSKNVHNLSIRGKNNQLSYFVSGGYADVVGFIKNEGYKRYSYRINVDAEIVNWFSVGIESFLTRSDYSGVSPDFNSIFNLQPFAPVTDDNGEYIIQPEGSYISPYIQTQQDDSEKRLNIFGNLYAKIQLPLKGLDYKINFSQNYRANNNDRFDPYGANFQGYGYKNSDINYDWSVDNILTYKNTFNKVHNINATLVYGVEKRNYSFTYSSAQNFVNDQLGFNRLQAGDPALFSVNTGAEEEQSLYSMGRVLYNYNNKYLFTGTIRRDGFSGFGTNKKIGVFPSVAFGWVASEEEFIGGNLDWLDYLKIRGSYGSTGRRGIGRYDTKAIVSASPYYIFGDGESSQIGQWLSSLSNNDLGWETTTGINLGVDFNIFKSKLFGNIEYYDNSTKDVLYPIQLPQMTGFGSINTNIGEVANHGLEFTLNSQIINTSDLTWNFGINFSRNRNEIVSLLGYDNNGDGREDDLVANRLFIGEPTGIVYDYEITGIWQFADEEAGVIPEGFSVGQYKIADLNQVGISASDDMKILGYIDPSYRIGISNTVEYKQFKLYVFINSIQGGKDYYYGRDDPYVDTYDRLTYRNVPTGAWDYWMPENPDARFRRLDSNSAYNPNRYLQRNFVRIQDLSLSYSFRSNLLNKFDIKTLRVYVSGKNLATFTKWRGWDPETGVGFTHGRPVMKSYSIGLNVEF